LVEVFRDDFSEASINTSKWTVLKGVAELSGGCLRITDQCITGHAFMKYGTLTVRLSATTLDTGGRIMVYLCSRDAIISGATPGPLDDYIRLGFWINDGWIHLRTQKDGNASQTPNITGVDMSTFHTYEIVWKPNNVQLYIDGTPRGTLTDYVIDTPARIHFQPGYTPLGSFDWVSMETDREAEYSNPDISWAGQISIGNKYIQFNQYTWDPVAEKATIDVTRAAGTYEVGLYIPTAWSSHYCKVKVDGITWTRVSFSKNTRELFIGDLSGTGIEVLLIHPPQVLIDLAYWLITHNIDISWLLKFWNRLSQAFKTILNYITSKIYIIHGG